MATNKKAQYVEPTDFFPKDILKKFKLGEYNDEPEVAQKTAKDKDKTNKAIRDYVNGKK